MTKLGSWRRIFRFVLFYLVLFKFVLAFFLLLYPSFLLTELHLGLYIFFASQKVSSTVAVKDCFHLSLPFSSTMHTKELKKQQKLPGIQVNSLTKVSLRTTTQSARQMKLASVLPHFSQLFVPSSPDFFTSPALLISTSSTRSPTYPLTYCCIRITRQMVLSLNVLVSQVSFGIFLPLECNECVHK